MAAAAAPAAVKETVGVKGVLNQFIDQKECLNQSTGNTIENLFTSDTSSYLESDPDGADSELLITVGFRVPVNISAIKVLVPEGSVEDETAPAGLKVFVGQNANMGFDEARDNAATQEFDPVRPGEDMEVRFVKFQSISILKLFVPGSVGGVAGDDKTCKIASIQFIGSEAQNSDIKEWKKPQG